jgi:uncharacterized damage-inducible protein DinB
MDVNDIRTLYAYNRWANLRMFAELEELNEEQLSAARESSFPSIWESAFHIVGAEWLWLKRWKGASPRASVADPAMSPSAWDGFTPSDAPRIDELRRLPALRQFAETIDCERREFLDKLTETSLHDRFHFTDMSGAPHSEPLVQVMQHLVNHGSYHRGQVTTLLRQAGAQPVALDMIYFFREQRSGAANG